MHANVLLARLDERDRELFYRWTLFSESRRWVRRFWTALTHLGGASCTLLAAAIPLRVDGVVGVAARHAMTTLVLSHLIVQLVKRTVGRPRPSRVSPQRVLLISEPDRFSFPSGHSAAAMSVAFAYAVAFPSTAAILIPLAVLVGLSRVCLGVHYPGDVLIGQLIALLTGLSIVLG